MNKVIVMGNLGNDPEMRYTQNQMAVATFNMATTEYKTDQQGNRQEYTEWHRIVVWGKQAENASKYLQKGSKVLVEGNLKTRSWDDQNSGQKKYVTEVVCKRLHFCERAKQNGGSPRQSNQSQGSLDDIPF